MKSSKTKTILLVIVGLILLGIGIWTSGFLLKGRAIKNDTAQQLRAMVLPGQKEVYAGQYNRTCFLASFRTPVLDTYCEWVGARYYEFNEQTIAKGVEQLKDVIRNEGYIEQDYNSFPTDVMAALETSPAVSGEFVDSPRHAHINVIDLSCYKPALTTRISISALNGSSSPIPDELSAAVAAKIDPTARTILCGYVIESGWFIFHF